MLVLFFAGTLLLTPLSALACGYGNSGGSDYTPQWQSPYTDGQNVSAIGIDQAEEIAQKHVSRLNPKLAIGSINDSGGFFEVEVINKNSEVVQLLGVDKLSGRLMLIN